MKKIIYKFCKLEIAPHVEDFFLIAAVFIFSLLRIPSLIEPEWYGDEGIYQVIGFALNNGRVLYKDIWDNKPPLLYAYYALVNGDLFAIKFLSLIFGIASVVVFFFLAKRIFSKKILPVYISTAVFVYLFGTPLLEGNVANAENFMVFPILFSLFLITKLTSASKPIVPLLSGFLLSIAFLTKIVAVFDFGAFLLMLLCLKYYNKNILDVKKHLFQGPKQFVRAMKQEMLLCAAFIIPVFLTWIYFTLIGASIEFLTATFSNNIGYVGWKNYFVANIGSLQFSIPQGLLLFKMVLLLVGIVAIVIWRKKFSIPALIIYIWVLFSLFNAFFSGRPYTHYVLTLVPSFSLLVGLVFMHTRRTLVHLFVVIFIVFLVRENFDTYKKTKLYYMNYKDFVMNEKSIGEYQKFFDSDTPKNYSIAEFIKSNTKNNENVFLVSNSSTIYYIAEKLPPGRYIVGYHIESYGKEAVDETKKALLIKKPKYIISTNDKLSKNFIDNYKLQYILHNVKIYEKQL